MGGQQSKANDTNKSKRSFESHPDDWPWIWALSDGSILDWKKEFLQNDNDDAAADYVAIIQTRAKKQQNLPVPISDTLYLGNAACINQNITKIVEELGITAVLNMAGPFALPSKTIRVLKEKGVEYKRIDADDEIEYPLLEKHWEEAKSFIDSNATITKTNPTGKLKRCVVHCVAGMNRSALIVAAYYMIKTQTPVLETVKHVRKQRGNVALQNEGFQEQLVAFARQENLLGPKPGTEESFIKELPPPDNRETRKNRPNPLDRL